MSGKKMTKGLLRTTRGKARVALLTEMLHDLSAQLAWVDEELAKLGEDAVLICYRRSGLGPL